MITTHDQESLFTLIADYMSADVECIAIGGTAMMFLGYKNTTKDIDVVFKNKEDRNVFINAIEKLGYSQTSMKVVYKNKKRSHKNNPLMYARGEDRFDIFLKDVFGFKIDFTSEYVTQRHDFIGKKELVVYVLNKEHIFLLKSITNREKDFEDIETIVKIEPLINWDLIINLAIEQKKGNPLILVDLEEKMQKLREHIFIKEEYFKRIYKEGLKP